MSPTTPLNPAGKPDTKTSSLWAEALRKLAESPFKTLSVTVAMLGGLLLLMFLADIQFLPDLDLAGAMSMFYAVALLGLLLILTMAFSLVMPGLIMRSIRPKFGAVEAGRGAAVVAHAGYPAEPMVPRRRKSPWAELVPWVVACAFWLVTLAWWVTDSTAMCWLITVGALLCALIAVVLALRESRESALRMAGESVAAVGSFVMPVFVIVQLMALGELRHEPISWSVLLTLALLLVCSGVAAWVLSTPHPDIGFWFGSVFALGLLTLVASQTHSVTVIPHAIVRKLGLGDIEFARVGLTATGCRQLNAVLGEGACPEPPGPDVVASLCPVRIRSRVGQQLLLEFGEVTWKPQNGGKGQAAGWALETPMRRVVLDKSQLPSWQPLNAVVDVAELPDAAASATRSITLWRKPSADVDDRVTRLCDARIDPAQPASAPASAAVSASSPASGALPPRASRG